MPKKGKKGKKEDPEVVAARLAQEAAEAEERRRHEQEVADKAATALRAVPGAFLRRQDASRGLVSAATSNGNSACPCRESRGSAREAQAHF